ncbi:hypothetical protein LOH54_07490 [Sulfurimonas sp. HSL-3221]|uniref:hypothetical protein n=1 Tax=Thiomicrolovo sulfuroxydans TaxID=2894755 RepID=UPI001E53DBE4|nr:hypothetical protein [Sulfurimonas sp. HSL-3221]UFS61503.1 hypothetical protein LOH54_07490 [Sulfurimonas sp. HSL-3221]
MAKKKILAIGFSLPDENIGYSDFDSDISLLDWDIILFKPNINGYIYRRESMFEGKPCLSDNESFKLKAQTEHWRREIKTAVEHGKLVIVFMDELKLISIATGQKEYSGTGRNQKITRIVADYNNYRSIPIDFKLINSKGKEIKLSTKNTELISSYWNEFSGASSYKVIIEGGGIPCLVTKHGEKVVGTIARSKNSAGALVCLPDVDFYQDTFFNEEDEEDEWSSEGKQFAARFIKEIVSLDKSLRSTGELTPEPEWAKDSQYKLDQENTAYEKLLKIEEKLELIQIEKEAIVDEINDLERLRNLLFEKGKPLEYAILDALKTLGFEVSQFDNGESEFDAVFESKEGRLIGEAEGKDNKAVNIDKLRQLALNIHEDLERDEIDKPAKPVLFGNAYRLLPINERSEPFTTKCITAATTSSTALIFCPDLFEVAKYLKDKRDSRFATKCRKAILNSVGRVNFPEVPQKTKKMSEQVTDEIQI